MATKLELAAFAENAYRPQRENTLNVPDWTFDSTIRGDNRGFGFDASVFTKNDGSEIVVAFRGTDFGLDPSDWIFANVDAALGSYSEQVMRAIEFMADVIDAHPGKKITLTGHSLGGGLASLMAAFFDKDAFVFAPAPFENTALGLTATDIAPGSVPVYVRFETDVLQQYLINYVKYQNDRDRVPSAAFMVYGNTLVNGSEAEQAVLFAARQQRVTDMYLEGGGGTLRGDDGSHVLLGGNGNEILEGGEGVDEYRFVSGDSSDTVVVEMSGMNCCRRESQRVRNRVCA